MTAVPLKEVIAALRHAQSMGVMTEANINIADRIEQHGIAPPDGMVLVKDRPVAWELVTMSTHRNIKVEILKSAPNLAAKRLHRVVVSSTALYAAAPKVKP